MKADQEFLEKMKCSSCYGKEVCKTVPCACAQSVIDIVVAMVFARLRDHYWDSLAPQKNLIIEHVYGALGPILGKGPLRPRKQPAPARCGGDDRQCLEPYHFDDGVPYCDTCGRFRSGVKAD